MSTEGIITFVATVLVLGTVYPLLGALYWQLAKRLADLQRDTVPRGEFKAHMRRLDESNIRIERAMGILPRHMLHSNPDSDPPEGH